MNEDDGEGFVWAPTPGIPVADRLPRYVVRSVTGWPTGLNSSLYGAKTREAPKTWQVQDSWNCWRVVRHTYAEHDADEQARILNFQHEARLRAQNLL